MTNLADIWETFTEEEINVIYHSWLYRNNLIGLAAPELATLPFMDRKKTSMVIKDYAHIFSKYVMPLQRKLNGKPD